MSPFSSSSYSLTPEALARELDAGEQVLWTGQPDPQRMFKRVIPAIFASGFMLAFSSFWMFVASTSLRSALANGRTPSVVEFLFPAFGLLFVGAGVSGLCSPWFARSTAKRTFYALTDRRALIVGENKRTVQSIMPTEFSLERRDYADGLGDLVLKRETRGSGNDAKTTERAFYGIPNAREVERLARELTQKAR